MNTMRDALLRLRTAFGLIMDEIEADPATTVVNVKVVGPSSERIVHSLSIADCFAEADRLLAMGNALDYLIWSHKNGAWWKADRYGYTDRLSLAGRFSRADALMHCANSIAGTAHKLGALADLPVRRADVLDMLRGPDGSEYQPGAATWE